MIRLAKEIDAAGLAELLDEETDEEVGAFLSPAPRPSPRPPLVLLRGGAGSD
jgi:hypothetical protein